MIVDLPGTDTSAVNAALVDIREAGGAVTLGRVLTLVIVTDEGAAEEAIAAANDASREHPCRIIVLARGTRRSSSRLDAQVRVGGDAGASEVVVLRLYGRLADHGEAVVVPLLLPDAPIVAWWPGAAPEHLASDPIGHLAHRRITDSARSSKPLRALAARRDDYTSGDTDFTWTRLTSWRALLAAALDQPPYERVEEAVVVGSPTSASSDLLAGWLADCLGCPVTRDRSPNAGVSEVRLTRASGTIVISRPEGKIATLVQPGQPDRRIALPRRTAAECLAEELRRLDADEVYAETLIAGMGRVTAGRSVKAVSQRSPRRSRRGPDHGQDLGPGIFPAPATSAAGMTVNATAAPTARSTGVRGARSAARAARERETVDETAATAPPADAAGASTPDRPAGPGEEETRREPPVPRAPARRRGARTPPARPAPKGRTARTTVGEESPTGARVRATRTATARPRKGTA